MGSPRDSGAHSLGDDQLSRRRTHARVRTRAAAPCAPERWELQPPSFTTPRRERACVRAGERSTVSLPCSGPTGASVMFFPVTETETRQKLLRNVKKEVGSALFRPRAHLVLSGAVRACSRACVCVCVDVVP